MLCPHYSYISNRAKTVNVSFNTKTRGIIQHGAIDSMGSKSAVKANEE
ncbi:Mobile element protein [Candidatus Enterovibrio altilux]|uniref:Mobile element protein n=1 Tax=Candidatus Enterovibrio altilux TaxID=1927128 RepID=A0A291BB55_9GAMM|nr:Mobile element protein [Candidatus Enterovibrio luxaltus]